MPNNISGSYASHTKEELLAEVKLRGIEGIQASSLKDDIVAALELNDEQADKEPAVTPPLPPPIASNIPQITEDEVSTESTDGIVFRDEDFSDGIYVMRKGLHVGEEFALFRHPKDTYERTHSLKNSKHFWQGKEEEFTSSFEKK